MRGDLLCPVCGCPLNAIPWVDGVASDEICRCCGIHFGVDDAVSDLETRDEIHRKWWDKWSKSGRKWQGAGGSPTDWDAMRQSWEAGLKRNTNLRKNAIEHLRVFASRKEQERFWLSDGSSGYVSSFIEECCGLYDDCGVGDLLKLEYSAFGGEIDNLLRKLDGVTDEIDQYKDEQESSFHHNDRDPQSLVAIAGCGSSPLEF